MGGSLLPTLQPLSRLSRPTSAGRSRPQRPPWNHPLRDNERLTDPPLRGSAPIARRKGIPNLPRSLVQTGLRSPPLRSGGETPPIAPCYPRLRQVAFGMYMPRFNAEVQTQKAGGQMRTTTPATPNPFTWRRFANVRMGDYLLGEDTVDLAELGFCGDTVTVSCPTCGEILGNVPVELLSDGLEDITTTHITPALDWHGAKNHPRPA